MRTTLKVDKDLFCKGEGDIVETCKVILTKLRQFV